MSRPKNKEELISLSQKNFVRLYDLIDTLGSKKADQEFPQGTMNRNIRDVLGHLYYWHIMMLDWHSVGMKGGKPDMPAKGYGWKDTPILNKEIWDKCQSHKLSEMKLLLQDTHGQMQYIIENFDGTHLFEKKKYKWTGSTSVGAYLISATSSHYDWAYKLIKKALS